MPHMNRYRSNPVWPRIQFRVAQAAAPARQILLRQLQGVEIKQMAGPKFVGTEEQPPIATVVGKLGIAANDLLFYAKGGGAWMRVDYTQSTLVGGTVAVQQLITDTRSGWTAGAGVEYAFNENLSAKLEYDYLGFGTKNYNFTNIQAGGLPVSIKSYTQMLTAGLNYRFNFGGGFARY